MGGYRKRITAVFCVFFILLFSACGSMYSAPGTRPEVIRNIFTFDDITWIEYEECSDALVGPGGKKMTAQDGEHMRYAGFLTLGSEEANILVDHYEWTEIDTNDFPFPSFKYVNATPFTGKKWYTNYILNYYIDDISDWDVMFLGFDGSDTIVFQIEERDR